MVKYEEHLMGAELQRIWRKTGHFFANIIISNQFTKVAEIGVLRGRCIKTVLSFSPANSLIKEYFAIDSWVVKGRGDGYKKVCTFMPWFKQLKVIKLPSLEAASLFRNGYLDVVFLDADHSYDAVIADIKAWMPKIRKGGIICGHDYSKEILPRSDVYGVNDAVDDFFGEKNVSLWPELFCWAIEV
jgi:hypothetical protein